jgi:hypothetical protein
VYRIGEMTGDEVIEASLLAPVIDVKLVLKNPFQ